MIRFTPSRHFAALHLAIAGLAFAGPVLAADSGPLIVFAATSLKSALDEIAAGWQRDAGQTVRVSYGPTSALARQVEQGAPADVFISADLDWMKFLAERRLVGDATALLGGRLVLIAPRNSKVVLPLRRGAPLAAALGDGRLAVANVESVPAGRYARAALESLGLWREVAGRLVQTDNVRAALRLVARGEVPLAVVYATDARAEPLVRVVAVFDESLHPPIRYVAAPVTGAQTRQAAAFIAHLRSRAARSVFEREGFTVLSDAGRK